MRYLLLPLLGLSLFLSSARADVIGFWAGANYWNYDISGTARYRSNNASDDVDVNDDLGYNDGSSPVIYATLEHPLPFLPNVRLMYTDIDESAAGVLSRTVTFGNTTFTASEAVTSSVSLKQTDVTLYYSPLDNIANLDLGLTLRYIDSKTRITGQSSGSEQADLSAWVPMFYAGVGIDLPLSGLAVGAEGSAVAYSGSSLYDFTVRATYLTPWRVGIDLGYRKLRLKLDDIDNSSADLEFSGPYAGAYLHF